MIGAARESATEITRSAKGLFKATRLWIPDLKCLDVAYHQPVGFSIAVTMLVTKSLQDILSIYFGRRSHELSVPVIFFVSRGG